MFEVDGEYENRIGKYTVLAIEAPKMHVRYHSGKHAQLNMAIQGRIWENILVERDSASQSAVAGGKGGASGRSSTRHFIKVVSVPVVDEMMFPGWHEHVVMANNQILAKRIKPGDRVIYYAAETNYFFAVSTITGERFTADPKDYFYTVEANSADFFQVDVDVSVPTPNSGILRSAVELDEYRDFEKLLQHPEALFPIGEDDFESLAEMLTELTEDDDEALVEDDLIEEDEE